MPGEDGAFDARREFRQRPEKTANLSVSSSLGAFVFVTSMRNLSNKASASDRVLFLRISVMTEADDWRSRRPLPSKLMSEICPPPA